MKKTSAAILLSMGLCSLLSATALSDVKEKIESMPLLKSANAKVNKVIELPSLYQVKGSASNGKESSVFMAFTTKNFDTIIMGQAFDAASGVPYTIPVDVNKLKEHVVFSKGNGKNEYYVVTDPECPYCQKLEQEITKKGLKEDVTVHYVLFPIDFHKDARAMSYYVMSQKTDALKAKALDEVAGGSKEFMKAKFSAEEIKKYNKALDDAIEASGIEGINGTPTVIDGSGGKSNPAFIIKA
jgi:thiol:disulfide interchange protein DsbC